MIIIVNASRKYIKTILQRSLVLLNFKFYSLVEAHLNWHFEWDQASHCHPITGTVQLFEVQTRAMQCLMLIGITGHFRKKTKDLNTLLNGLYAHLCQPSHKSCTAKESKMKALPLNAMSDALCVGDWKRPTPEKNYQHFQTLQN